jgi:hypothetical protein
LVHFQTLLAYAYKAAQHAFDFAPFLAETMIGFGIKPAHVVRDPKLSLQFGEGATCDAEKVKGIFVAAPVVALGDIRGHGERSPAHLITESIMRAQRRRRAGSVDVSRQ